MGRPRKHPIKEKIPATKNKFQVQLEARGYVTLNEREWKELNRFTKKCQDLTAVKLIDYAHFPPKVIRIISDWLKKFSPQK